MSSSYHPEGESHFVWDSIPHRALENVSDETRAEMLARTAIDASARIPVLFFFASSVFWLLVSATLGLLASMKLNMPMMLAGEAWLTYGRVWPAHVNTVVYGWASTGGIGIAVWLMARLSGSSVRFPNLLIAAAVLWNIGIAVGTYGILAGDSTSLLLLEFPGYITPVLFIAFILMASWVVLMFQTRTPGRTFVSQWYLVGAFFWFAWIYGTAQVLLVCHPAQGSFQAVVGAWYAQNVIGLWLTPLALAAALYLIPKVTGRAVCSYHLAITGFWSFALFSGWTGMSQLIGGPVPAWMVSASIVASMLMLIPVLIISINLLGTMRGSFNLLPYSPTLCFTVFGAFAFTTLSVLGTINSLRSVNAITNFTFVTLGQSSLAIYGFISMILFGAMYYIIPRLVQAEWPCLNLIRWHFWLSSVSLVLVVLSLYLAGLLQGLGLADGKIAFIAVTNLIRPFLFVYGVAVIGLVASQFVFGVSFVLMLLKAGPVRRDVVAYETQSPMVRV